jgi:hypothetical protein
VRPAGVVVVVAHRELTETGPVPNPMLLTAGNSHLPDWDRFDGWSCWQ